VVALVSVSFAGPIAAPVRSEALQPVPCTPGTGFCYGGQHWRIQNLPVRLKLNNAFAPASISSGELLAAAIGAAAAWNAVWPATGTNQVACLGAVPGTAICVDPVVATSGSPGANTVYWTDFCPPLSGPCMPLATTSRCNTSGIAACTSSFTGPGHIVRANVALNWHIPAAWIQAGDEEARGEVRGNLDGLCDPLLGSSTCQPGWYDLQNLLTHELGHFLGLDHPCTNQNNPSTCMVWDWPQTMWPTIYQGETSKRTLHYGDVLGAHLAASDSAASITE
jgi:hypothetical protein